MKLFKVNKGTEVLLEGENNDFKKTICKKDAHFEIEELITDPVSYFNSIRNKNVSNDKEFPIQTFSQGFYKFQLTKGINTNSDYKYVYVKHNDVEVI